MRYALPLRGKDASIHVHSRFWTQRRVRNALALATAATLAATFGVVSLIANAGP